MFRQWVPLCSRVVCCVPLSVTQTLCVPAVGAAVFQGGLFGVAAQFPARYLSAVISGQALGAVFACIARSVPTDRRLVVSVNGRGETECFD